MRLDSTILDIQPATAPFPVFLPNGDAVWSTHTGHINIPELPPEATEAHMFPDLHSNALISVRLLCKHGCEVLFTETKATVHYNNKVILTGHLDDCGLYRVPLKPLRQYHTANAMIDAKTQHELIQYLHATLGSPTEATWLLAIKNNHFTTWPLITQQHVRTYFRRTTATALGHMDQCRQNVRSTKPPKDLKTASQLRQEPHSALNTRPQDPKSSRQTEKELTSFLSKLLPPPNDEVVGQIQPGDQKSSRRTEKEQNSSFSKPLLPPTEEVVGQLQPLDTDTGTRTHSVYCAVEETQPPITLTGKTYSDQTGHFRVDSSSGNKYIMVLYDYDSNAILTAALPNKQASSIKNAYTTLYHRLCQRGFKPRLHTLDNEASNILKEFLTDHQVQYQLVPSGMHRRNAAERAIRTFKNHFKSTLATTDRRFPAKLWDQLLRQAEITLNLLRASRLHPQLSAQASLFGQFDFNRTPMAPPGTRVIVHVKPDRRGSWAANGLHGWYLGPAMEHYRCYKCYIESTDGIRISDTVQFFPTTVPFPALSSTDNIFRAASWLAESLKNPPHPGVPFVTIGTAQTQALDTLTDIFQASIGQTSELTTPSSGGDPHCQVPRDLPVSKPAALPCPLPGVAKHLPSSQPATRTPITAALQSKSTKSHSLTSDYIKQYMHRHYACAVTDPKTGQQMEYRHLIKNPDTKAIWELSCANEYGRLTNGIRDIEGTNTIRFIPLSAIPRGRKPTYSRYVCEIRPQKKEMHRTRITVGGNLIDYPGDVATKTADLTTAKLIWNSVISTPGAKYMCLDVKNFFLGTPLDRPEYIRFAMDMIPQEIILKYNLLDMAVNGAVYAEILKGMYGLPQAGILANKLLEKRLNAKGYFHHRHTPGLWYHTTRPISFTLVVDDFGVKYVGKEHADHLKASLEEHYEVSVDWTGALYCGITLDWNYATRTVDLSMPKYVIAALHRFTHQRPTRWQYAPYKAAPLQYGTKVQMTAAPDMSTPLPKQRITRLQQIIGTFLFYARAVDPTMLVALSTLASEQSRGTTQTDNAMNQFLDYCATNPHTKIRYSASDMILRVHAQ